MTTIPAPSSAQTREEWPDAEFELAEGQSLHELDKDEDWDIEMSLGQTGGAKAQAVVAGLSARRSSSTAEFNIRPPMQFSDDDEDEGVSTIKASALPCHQPATTTTPPAIDEDLESAFSLPSELTQLSLRPLSLNHRSSKNSLEWGDKDYTYSSQSSDAYSSLGFADISPSSNSASSASSICLPEETDDDDDEGELEGLVIPSNLFSSGKDLAKILEKKKRTPLVDEHVKIASPEDDYEDGLEIDDDVDLSPSRLLMTTQQAKAHWSAAVRSISAPPRPTTLKPPPRKADRARSPTNPPVSSQSQFQKLRLSPSPPLHPPHPSRAQTFQALTSAPPVAPSSSLLAAKPGSLRGQKSHSVLTGPSPPPSLRKMTRKASLSSLIGSEQPQASGSGHKPARYEEPTAASISRAKASRSATSRAQDYKVPPTRPTTPSTNSAAVRLTMPTVLRHKSRPALSSVFTAAGPSSSQTPPAPPTSPPPSRPSSKASVRSMTRTPSNSQPAAPKILRRPKRQRTYGDGTELDGFDDLPTDRDKESQYRVQPKATGNRVPGGSYPAVKPTEKGTIRRKSGRESLTGNAELPAPLATATNTLKRTSRIEFPTKASLDVPVKKKKATSPSSPHTCRKPTLIRNLGGASAPKVVGDMKWNPQTLRWEGNDQVLRDFDAVVGTSTRPALITHLTGSSLGSPAGSFAAGARRVGNMIFDPSRMCWISTLPPEEDEPDVFADMADDEDDDIMWDSKGDTIRAVSRLGVSADNKSSSSRLPEAPSPARSHTRTLSESGSERGSRASLLVCDVDEAFVALCKAAEERHRSEMKGWQTSLARLSNDGDLEPDRSYLYEIRALATRRY